MKRGRQRIRLNRGTRADPELGDVWADVADCNDLADVIRILQAGRQTADRRRLEEFLLTMSLPQGVPIDEVKRWRGIVEACAAKAPRGARGVYRAVIAARLAAS